MAALAKEFLKEKVKEMTISLKEEWDEKEFEKHIQEEKDVWKFIVNVMDAYAEKKIKEFIEFEKALRNFGNLKDADC